MSQPAFALKDKVSFARMAALDLTYDLKVPATLLLRLNEACFKIIGDPVLHIHFGRDLQGLNIVEGSVSCMVELICARCFKPFSCHLKSQFSSTPDYKKAQSLKIADKLDLIELESDGTFDTLSYVEDCLLLELPLIFEHDKDCDLKGNSWSFGDHEPKSSDNPFAALGSLKKLTF